MSEHSFVKSNISNEENQNECSQNNLQVNPSQGNKDNISRKLTSRTMSNKITFHPRMKELINDKIFQYFFTSYFNSKEYSEFRSLTELERLNFMIDLYFYIMVDINKDNIFDLKELNTEEQLKNIQGEIMDRILMLKDEVSRRKIVYSMKQYNICSISEQNNINNRLQEILNKYKFDNYNNIMNDIDNEFSDEEANPKKTKQYSMPFLSSETNPSNRNHTKIETKSIQKTNVYTNPTRMEQSKSFIKIEYGKVQLVKMGAIKKTNQYKLMDNSKEISYTPDKTVLISKNNNIKETNVTHYVCNPKLKKIKHPNFSEFVTPLSYKSLTNPKKVSIITKENIFTKGSSSNYQITNNNNSSLVSLNKTSRNIGTKKVNNSIYIEDSVIFNQMMMNQQHNIILERSRNNNTEMNELLYKLYFNEEEPIILNKNELNKIGLLLIELVQKEKEQNKTFSTLGDCSEVVQSIENRLKESESFIMNYK